MKPSRAETKSCCSMSGVRGSWHYWALVALDSSTAQFCRLWAFVVSVSGQYLVPATFLSGHLMPHLAGISNIQASITVQPPPSQRHIVASQLPYWVWYCHPLLCFSGFLQSWHKFLLFLPSYILKMWMSSPSLTASSRWSLAHLDHGCSTCVCSCGWTWGNTYLPGCHFPSEPCLLSQCKALDTFTGTRFFQQLQPVYPRSALPSTWSNLYPPNNILHISPHHFLLVLIVNLDRCSDQ